MSRTKQVVRCAVYTRKSTEEGLDKEFSSLDAQRESGEAYVKSQASLGWTCLRTRYDDGGFTGGNMERPALQRLLADIAMGAVDCVVVYKVDRLSRSLLDFARMMGIFEQRQVSFVSVTQQFNTATSMGRLVLNVLLSFAQFEREIISERTRDKIAAARRKGKWAGGMPVLGYDVDSRSLKLVVNEAEANQVRGIFALYLQHQGLIPVVQELEKRGWTTKSWQTRKGRIVEGKPLTKTSLHQLLTNVVYTGKIRYKQEVHSGEHQAIVDPEVWQRVNDRLKSQAPRCRRRCPSNALLKGLLFCRPCGRAMTPTHCRKNGSQRYHYYVCQSALKRGQQRCPSGPLSQGRIEDWLLEQLAKAAKDYSQKGKCPFPELTQWERLPIEDRTRLLRQWVERVEYDGAAGKVAITFHPLNEVKAKTRRKTDDDPAHHWVHRRLTPP
jgi:site-specific DNA recombinase